MLIKIARGLAKSMRITLSEYQRMLKLERNLKALWACVRKLTPLLTIPAVDMWAT